MIRGAEFEKDPVLESEDSRKRGLVFDLVSFHAGSANQAAGVMGGPWASRPTGGLAASSMGKVA